MDANIARITIEFLKRVQLTGAEVDAYVAVMNALTAEAAKEEPVDEQTEVH